MDIKPVYAPCSRCGAARKEKMYRGSDLRKVRQLAGLTLREMAKRVKKSAAFISDVELGRRRASAEVVAAYEALS